MLVIYILINLIIPIAVIAGIVKLATYLQRKSNKESNIYTNNDSERLLKQRNREWVSFILGYRAISRKDEEKQLINRMLDDIKNQGLVSENEVDWLENNSNESTADEGTSPSPVIASLDSQKEPSITTATDEDDWLAINVKPKDAHAIRLDNISLLLYFGAFLFVSAVGLFVGFAGADGWIRTLAVLFVTLAMYIAGLWVYEAKPALRPAGLAFSGIGIAIAPLIGVAANAYIIGTSPQVIWFLTSVFCLALYGHALVTLKKPLINYIFIFTLLSLFESGVSLIDAPVYYFGWTMAVIGLLLQAVSYWRDIWPEFRESSKTGSQIYIPLAVFVSLVILPEQGFGQLGVSLIIAAIYYGLEAWRASKSEIQTNNALASHISLLVGLTSLFYGFSHDTRSTGFFLASLSIAHVAVIYVNKKSEIIQNIASLMLASSLVSMLLIFDNYAAITLMMIITTFQAVMVWWRLQRVDSYGWAAIIWTLIPVVLSKLAIRPELSTDNLIIISILSLIIHVAFYLSVARPKLSEIDFDTPRSLLLIQVAAVAATIMFTSGGIALVALFVLSLVLLALSLYDKDNIWEITSGLVISLAIVRNWEDQLLIASMMLALAYNILLSLRFRSEANRWISTGLWLLWPIGLGGLTTTQHWNGVQYAWCYVVIMLGLVISRAFARGVVFASKNIPLSSYVRNASQSYEVGYCMAGLLAVVISLAAASSQLHTSGILAAISGMFIIIAYLIEKNPGLSAIQPILWQAILISALRPNSEEPGLTIFVFASSIVAVVSYGVCRLLEQDKQFRKYITPGILQVVVAASFVAPLSGMFIESVSFAMPIGLFIAGVILYDCWREKQQNLKEISVFIMVAAGMWALHYLGVSEFQAYSHILAFMFAGFAWWRYYIGDTKTSDNYIYIALSVATIPLILRALNDDSGGIYGWWLLIEQVVLMLIGMSIRKRFVIMWGLYVAVGSVLYQLRDLGYAALAVLAIFVIGIAVYQLQKYNKPEQ